MNNSIKKLHQTITEAVDKFMGKVPAMQQRILDSINRELKELVLDSNGLIKPTIKNIETFAKIKRQLAELIVTPEYKKDVRSFLESYNEVTKIQNQFFRDLNKDYKPPAVVKEIQKQSMATTAKQLTETGIAAGLSNEVEKILQTNLTSRSRYSALTKQFRDLLTTTDKSPGLVDRYARTIVTDAINGYAAQYMQTVTADLGSEWFMYAGSDVAKTRPFCDAMTDREAFHISEVPSLLKGEGLTYIDYKTKERKSVTLYDKTGLPHGMKPETTPANFFVLRGGYNCGHQITPVSERLVKRTFPELYKEIISKESYKAWARLHKTKEEREKKTEERKEIKKQQEPPQPSPPPPAQSFDHPLKTVDGFTGQYKEINKEATEMIAAVHSVPRLLPMVPVKSGKAISTGERGHYTHGPTQPVEIVIRHGDEGGMHTYVHEYGHYLDHVAFGSKKDSHYMASGIPDSPIGEVIRIAKESKTIKTLQEALNKGFYVHIENGKSIRMPIKLKSHVSYLLREREIWARAYSQYIAVKQMQAGNFDLMEGQNANDYSKRIGFHHQWPDEDFKEIEKAIDDAFKKLGWIK